MPSLNHGRRDATGTRSGFPCQDAQREKSQILYYSAHLAFETILFETRYTLKEDALRNTEQTSVVAAVEF